MKRTIVTGGTRGIGAATALRLRAEGHDVIALGSEVEATDHDAVAAAFARRDEGRGFTGLVVSAGIWEPSPLGEDLAAVAAQHRRVLDVNVIGAVNAMGAFLRHARRDEPASVVLVGSTAGQRGESGHGAYAASKAALMGLAKSWAVELASRGVRVNVVAPGWVDTDMTARELGDPARRAEIERAIPRGRVATAGDLAGPIAFLLSDDALHVTGTVVSVNGGGVLASF